MQVYYQIPIRSKLGVAHQNGLCYNCSKPIDDGGATDRPEKAGGPVWACWPNSPAFVVCACALRGRATGTSVGVLRGARFCEYSGRWYCRLCHLNQRSVVPARILQAWDFSDTIWDEAVFDVEVFNDGLYAKVKALAEMRV